MIKKLLLLLMVSFASFGIQHYIFAKEQIHHASSSQLQEQEKYKIKKLFTVDGCTVYRFEEDGAVYFSKCKETINTLERK